MKTIVLAAGKSSRIAAVAGDLPKPLLSLAGEPILARNLRWLASQGIEQVWINLHYKPDKIRQVIGNELAGVRINYVQESTILGTAGAVRNIAGHWDDVVLVIYGDNLVAIDLAAMCYEHRRRQAAVSVAVFDRNRHPHTGIAGGRVKIDADRRIVEFVEGADDELSSLVNAGVYLIVPAVVAQIPPAQFFDFAKDLFPRLLAEQQPLYAHLIDGYCLGIDTPESYRRAVALVESGACRI
ncbi:MAG TPA: nucleotidyltransferase family protein [Candidatus Binataceae bacterium]|nr:nucleotidyltransferase family protein [Candidatus Binataceae bacterium]